MPLYPGQNTADPTTEAYLVFVDLRAGSSDSSVPITYSFTGLYGNVVAFNMYGYSPTGGGVDPGKPGIDWTNDTSTNGYIITDTAHLPLWPFLFRPLRCSWQGAFSLSS